MHSIAMQFRNTAFAAALALLPAAYPALAQVGGELVGHWRKTIVDLERSIDYNLVLNADGTAQQWTVTAMETESPTAGTWEASDTTLTLRMGGSEEAAAPYFFHEGQLVFPNIEGSRRFWERIE